MKQNFLSLFFLLFPPNIFEGTFLTDAAAAAAAAAATGSGEFVEAKSNEEIIGSNEF